MRSEIIILIIIIIAPLLYYIIRTLKPKILGIREIVDKELSAENDIYEGDMCIFLDSDLYNNRLFTDENQPITADLVERNEKDVGRGIKLNSGKHYTVKCDECKKYIYKDERGNCSPYIYDGRYTASNSLGVCTTIGYPKPCDQVAKILL
jgi:hypothetical protein